MFNKQMEKFADVFIIKEIVNKKDKDIITYGLSSAIEVAFNIITTIILGIVFGLALESFIFLISFSLIRTYSGGYHCEKPINCYLLSSGIVVLVLAIVKLIPKGYIILMDIVLLLISAPVIIKFVPVEALNKPLDMDEQNHYRKKALINLTIGCVLIIILHLFQLHSFAFVISLAIMVSACLVFLQVVISKQKIG